MDFVVSEIQKNSSLFIRQRNDLSFEDCARLCVREPAFECRSLSYSNARANCKWSSISLSDINVVTTSPFLNMSAVEYTWFYRDPLYNYVEYPFKVTTSTDSIVLEALDANECAVLCDQEKSIKCLSFNLCEMKDSTKPFKCLLSDRNIHSTEKNSSLTDYPLCTHYSSAWTSEIDLIYIIFKFLFALNN